MSAKLKNEIEAGKDLFAGLKITSVFADFEFIDTALSGTVYRDRIGFYNATKRLSTDGFLKRRDEIIHTANGLLQIFEAGYKAGFNAHQLQNEIKK